MVSSSLRGVISTLLCNERFEQIFASSETWSNRIVEREGAMDICLFLR